MQTDRSATALLLDLAPSALAGINLLSFTVTPRFRGIKDLPRGLHVLFTGSSNAFSVRHGIWFNVEGRDSFFISRWKPEHETLVAEHDEAENLRWRANLGEFWREGLTPYRQSAGHEVSSKDNDWAVLTSCITPRLLSRITHGDWTLTSASSAIVDRDDIPGIRPEDFSSADEKELSLLPIDLRRTWREGATGRERTEAATDRTWALQNLVELCTEGSYHDVIGELQFCFLMTLTLNNWSCFEQWKRLLTLVLTCRSGVVMHSDFYIHFIAALRLQLQHLKDAENGLVDMADEGESLLKNLLVRFCKGISELQSLEQQDVLDELDDLEAYLKAEYRWEVGGTYAKSGFLELEDGEQIHMDTTAYDEDDETGEYAPQIVDLSPEQARLLHIDGSPDLLARIEHTHLDEPNHGIEFRDISPKEDSESDDQEHEDDEELEELEDMDPRY